jgi:folate-binding protein YgfZ
MNNWLTLPHLAGLKIQGEDAQAFAHAQFTTAFAAEREPGWNLTAWCNPKGKVISVMLARSRLAEVDLVVPATQLEFLARRLPMYAIGRKVVLRTGLSVCGCLEPVDAPDRVVGPDPRRGIELDIDAHGDRPESVERWQTLDIRAGIAWLSPERSEQFLPQALGLEERGGLSYRKGCYPGQEVIARVHYLGKAKERLLAYRLGGHLDCRDMDLQDDSGLRIGRIIASAPYQEDTVGLAVVGIDSAAGQAVVCGNHHGRLSEPAALC